LILQPHVRTIPVIKDLLRKLPPTVEAVLLVSSRREARRFTPWLDAHRSDLRCPVRVLVAPAYAPYSAWVRDSYICLATPRHDLVFVRPAAAGIYINHLRGDAYTPVAAARLAGGILYDARIFFEGGNVRIGLRPHGQRDVFINSHLFQANQELGIPDAVIREEIPALFGPTVKVLPEVDPHLDTYITFARGGNVFVGDPRLALPYLNGQPTTSQEAMSRIRRHDYITKLDQVAKGLHRLGYRVHRLPWLPQPIVESTHVFPTYNNGVFLDSRTF